MPKITVSKKEMEKLIGTNVDTEKLIELMFMYLKADTDKVEGDELTIKLEDTNRPDLWSVEGLARALRNLLGRDTGTKEYIVKESNVQITVDDLQVKNIRPFIGCAVIKGVKLTDELIKSFMQMQDKLDKNYGRKRKKTSIGFYDLSKIKSPILYTTVEPESVKFVPLGFTEEMTPAQIIEEHPKGKEYGHIIKDNEEYPMLIDSDNQILSMPPIINSNDLGGVNEDTKELLIEVTGTDDIAVSNVLGIICSALSEQGGQIYSTKIKYKDSKKEEFTPNLKSTEFDIKPSYIEKRIGLGLDIREISKILEKMGYDVIQADDKTDQLKLMIPFYRKDIMHAVDVVEDVAIGYGYNNIEPAEIKVPTTGKLSEKSTKLNLIREIMIGMGHQETLSFMLTNKELLLNKMQKETSEIVEIANPISSNWDVVRNNLLPVVMNFLASNKTVEFPQKIYELGDVIFPDDSEETKIKQITTLCAAITHPKVTFTEIKSVLDKLSNDLNLHFEVQAEDSPSFIPGRRGLVKLGKKTIGQIGEIHPNVIENFGLENPVAVFEINVGEL